ncbi:hypothetical protein NUW54_g4965 [Trametes sanguinea]|uniref:Uncharacterized protein n=1 Tax=Trametes sanguinea TaxID=158606 RepID=A0ACC1PY01_9APHY|nr:hypothetical protein NUW54_g4965 [Trametes sanguinea]
MNQGDTGLRCYRLQHYFNCTSSNDNHQDHRNKLVVCERQPCPNRFITAAKQALNLNLVPPKENDQVIQGRNLPGTTLTNSPVEQASSIQPPGSVATTPRIPPQAQLSSPPFLSFTSTLSEEAKDQADQESLEVEEEDQAGQVDQADQVDQVSQVDQENQEAEKEDREEKDQTQEQDNPTLQDPKKAPMNSSPASISFSAVDPATTPTMSPWSSWPFLISMETPDGGQKPGTWQHFREDFLTVFGEQDLVQTAAIQLATLRYGSREPLDRFNAKILHLFIKGHITEDHAQMAWYNSKLPGFLRDKIALTYPQPSNMDGLMDYALQLNQAYLLNRAVDTSQEHRIQRTSTLRPKEATVRAVSTGKLEQRMRQELIRQNKCFYCREVGHRAANYPAKRNNNPKTRAV